MCNKAFVCLQKYILENLVAWNGNLKISSGTGEEEEVPPCWQQISASFNFLFGEQIYFMMEWL